LSLRGEKSAMRTPKQSISLDRHARLRRARDDKAKCTTTRRPAPSHAVLGVAA
jgi:hypothetical protein